MTEPIRPTEPSAADLVRQYAGLVEEYVAGVSMLSTMRAAEMERAARLTSAIADCNARLKAANAALREQLRKGATA